ncbi:hypothetical protein [Ornithinimicrobium sp. INDO-MA30-4]|uniref:hypothetical protein n=1 Tax=Ornithinimicrobium sp. INDO-MA30-4 TaxID=2908651 RepID=UPI001F19E925|nr:hypothetical protein [Ornithinimicrobium sp. INDO-MA30-4]UJH71237.1 hypothetical protein L0A91_05395 [Ornithinimicrobium sp. INDO-MA30-4]
MWSDSAEARKQRAGVEAIDVIATQAGIGVQRTPEVVAVTVPETARTPVVKESVAIEDNTWAFQLSARGFWQVHPGAATTFSQTVLGWLDTQPGRVPWICMPVLVCLPAGFRRPSVRRGG